LSEVRVQIESQFCNGLFYESHACYEEALKLSHELLIGVTVFFRDPEALDVLAREFLD
jgi:hypothetical protein